jgi:ABC-type hemin transport system substrate-binding protein
LISLLSKSVKLKSKAQSASQKAATVRIVSLVPSLTELVCELGLAPHLVGRTGFCIHPSALVRGVTKLGGTKQVDEEALLALRPTHLIVNKDENEAPLVSRLRAEIPNILVTHPIQVEDNFLLFEQFSQSFGELDGVLNAADQLTHRLRLALANNAQTLANMAPESVLYLIWKKPWMSIASNTYIASMLRTVGWHSDLGPQQASAALAEIGATRYPSLSDEEVFGSQAKRIFLSSEPYRFLQRHAQTLQSGLPPNSPARVHIIDGEMCSWYGPRAIQGLEYLLQLRQSLK